MAGELEGRVALVTGASSGIGAATAKALAGAGAAVTLAARRTHRLEALAEEVERAGGRALAVACDVTLREDPARAVARTLETFGGLDVLVSNAGVMPLSPLERLRVDEWERMVDVNVKGVLFALAAALPPMLERGRGHVVHVGSVAGRRPFPGGTVYSATKFAVRALSWGMQLELSAARGIRVTDVQPGVVDTELAGATGDPASARAFAERWRGKRMLRPDDVARAVLYAVTAPDHVNVNEILVRPSDQET